MIREDTGYQVILSTAPDVEVARRIASELVERRLAACVNLVPAMESIYRWQGKVETSQEVLLVIKTSRLKQTKLLEALTELHPYDTPEGIALPIAAGLEKYLAWIGTSLGEDCDSLG